LFFRLFGVAKKAPNSSRVPGSGIATVELNRLAGTPPKMPLMVRNKSAWLFTLV
jgi:hypothetical protein